jgi:hypothetical protein
MDKTFVAGFSTGETIEAGVISGRTIWKSVAVEQAVVLVYDVAELGGFTEFPEASPAYVTYSGAGGEFEIPFVNPRRVYKVLAFLDKSADGEHDEGETVGCAAGETDLADSARAAGVNVVLCDADFRGAIGGRVEVELQPDSTGKGGDPSGLRIAVVAKPAADTSEAYRGLCNEKGEFSIACVKPGLYLMEAFVDLNANLRRDREDSLYVEAGDTLTVKPCAVPAGVAIRIEARSKP